MHSPKQLAIGLVLVLIAGIGIRNDFRRWRYDTYEAIDDYTDDWIRGYVFPIVFFGLLLLLGGAMVYGSFLPGSGITINFQFPYFRVAPQASLPSTTN